MVDLKDDTKEFVVEKAARGYEADEIQFLLKDQKDLPMAPSVDTIRDFMESDEGRKGIQLRQGIKQKKSEISKEDLVEELVDLKNDLRTWREELQDTEHGVTRNEAISNMVDVINKIGELIGELESGGVAGNVVKIDEMQTHVQNNFTQVVQHLPKEEKKDIVEQLEEDDDIENYMIQRKGEAEEKH